MCPLLLTVYTPGVTKEKRADSVLQYSGNDIKNSQHVCNRERKHVEMIILKKETDTNKFFLKCIYPHFSQGRALLLRMMAKEKKNMNRETKSKNQYCGSHTYFLTVP